MAPASLQRHTREEDVEGNHRMHCHLGFAAPSDWHRTWGVQLRAVWSRSKAALFALGAHAILPEQQHRQREEVQAPCAMRHGDYCPVGSSGGRSAVLYHTIVQQKTRNGWASGLFPTELATSV